MKFFASYKGLFVSLRRYWIDYGGMRDLLSSPLLHLSILITATSYKVWLDAKWPETPLTLLPNLLGFSLGAYALIFSLASEKLISALNTPQSDGKPTLLRMINATFLHFILVQAVAIIFALSQKSSALIELVEIIPIDNRVKLNIQFAMTSTAGAFGYWLTVYAVVLLIGAALAAYRLAIMSGKAAEISKRQVGGPGNP